MTLTEFLLARIAEDETAARAVPPLDYNFDMGGNRQDERWVFDRTLPSSADSMGNWSKHQHSQTTREHFQRWVPARVLAECAAKRRIVKHAEALIEEAAEMDERAGFPSDAPDGTSQRTDAMHLLKLLALPYADHPDWHEEWRP